MTLLKILVTASSLVILSACSHLPWSEPKPQPQVVSKIDYLRPTREKSIVGSAEVNAKNADSAAILGSLAEEAGFTYKQATSFKVTARLSNVTIEDAIAQISGEDNKIAVINYQTRSVLVLNKATLSLKMPIAFKPFIRGISGINVAEQSGMLVASVKGSGQELESVMSRFRRALEENMTKVEVSLEA